VGRLSEVDVGRGGRTGAPARVPQPPPRPEHVFLDYRLERVACVDETSDFGTTNEMETGVVTIAPSGRVRRSGAVDLGEFSDGQVKSYSPPRRLARFDLRRDGDFPKRYAVVFVLAETDVFSIDGFLAELYEQVRDDVEAALQGEGLDPTNRLQDAAKYLEVAADAIGGVTGTILSALAAIISFFASIFDNEIFKPRVALLTVHGFDTRFGSTGTDETGPRNFDFAGHGGEYRVRTTWAKATA
jgi:hypothetical protein